MDGAVIGLLAVIFAFIFPIIMVGMYNSHKKEMLKLNSQLTDSEKQRYDNDIAQMQKRLAVLEAIVTDKRYQLDQDISELKVVKQ